MAEILTDEKIDVLLQEYYQTYFGAQDTDHWYEAPAVNVRLFRRDGKLITLHCHPFNGTVNAKIRDMEESQ